MSNKLYNSTVFANNTFNLEALQKAYEELLVGNFDKLYDVQHSLSGLNRFDLTVNDLKHDKNINQYSMTMYPRRYTASLGFEFIPTHLRYAYRNSSLYNTLLNHESISSNLNLFKYNYMVFIDGLFVNFCEIFPREDNTIISIDIAEGVHTHGIPYSKFKQLKEKNAKITIIFVPNVSYSRNLTNLGIVNSSVNGINIKKGHNTLDITNKSLCFCNIDESMSMLHPMEFDIDESSVVCKFTCPDSIFTHPKLSMTWMNLDPTMTNIITVNPRDTNFFKLDHKMPVPVDNMLVIVKEGDAIRFDHDITIDLFYPNIYRVNNTTDNQTILVYYMYKDSVDYEYENELALFHKYSSNLLGEYTLDTVPDFIKNYKQVETKYSIDDFCGSVHVPNHDILSYKINNMQKYIDLDPNILTKYLIHQLGKSNKFYIDMSKIDLSLKIRHNTASEMELNIITFDSPHYVFMFRSNMIDNNFELKLFLDGRYLYDKDTVIIWDEDLFYIYIPVDLVKSSSVLEINRHTTFKYDKLITVDSIDASTKLNICDYKRTCLVDDIFVIDTETKDYISRESYKFFIKADNNEIIEIPTTSNTLITKPLYIKISDETLLGKELMIMVRNLSFQNDITYTSSDNGYKLVSIVSKSRNREGNYRIFRDGRCIPRNGFGFRESTNFLEPVKIALKFTPNVDEVMKIDHSPVNFKTVYFQKQIDRTGFVNITGKLDKPINLKWFDIFLDGMKVHKNNIEIISPGKFILHGIPSTKNLEIVENNRDYEILRLNSDSYSINDKIWDEMGDIRDNILGNYEELEDLLPDIIDDLIDDLLGDRLEFFEFEMRFTYINPNISQITKYYKDKYSSILTEDGVMFVNTNLNSGKVCNVLYKINANERSEVMNNVEGKNPSDIGGLADRFAISALYKSNKEHALPGEIMCDPVSGANLLMREDGTAISMDEITRLSSHIDKLYNNTIEFNRSKNIVSLEFENVDLPMQVNFDQNILTEGNIPLTITGGFFNLSFDVDTTVVVDHVNVISKLTPIVVVTYTTDTTVTIECPVTELSAKKLSSNVESITLDSIIIKRNKLDVTNSTSVILHSILLMM